MIQLLAAAVAGILLALAFEPFGFWIFAPIGLAIFIYVLHQVSIFHKFLIGVIFGLGFWLIQINWLSVLSPIVLIITAVALSIFYGFFAVVTEIYQKSKFWPIFTALSFLTLESLLNYWPLGGFNWGTIGYISANNPFSNIVQFIGVFGLSILIFILSVSLVMGFLLLKTKAFAAATVLLIIWALIPGVIELTGSRQEAAAVSSKMRIGVVQGNVPRLGLEFNEQRKAVYQNHLTETTRLLNKSSDSFDLIIWPENAPDVDPFANKEVLNELNELAQSAAAPILIGSRIESESGPINAGILISGETELVSAFLYAKQKLVPFGEKVPLEKFLAPIAANFGPISGSLIAGNSAGILDIDGKKIGLLICFEVAWGQLAKEVVEQGAEVLIVQTNNATYGLTSQLAQQFNIARLRAIESQKEVITVATSGISGQIDRDGTVLWQADEFVAASAALESNLYQGTTLGLILNYYLQIVVVSIFGLFVLIKLIIDRVKDYDKN